MIIEEPSAEYLSLDKTKEYTYLDYLKWQFTERVELIRGRVVKMSPGPNRRHQKLVVNSNRVFDFTFRNKKCDWYPAPFDVRLPVPKGEKPTTVVQPDICVICDISKLDDQGCDGAPDLIVEIVSPGNRKHDLEVKYELYQEAKVKEYWIIDSEQRSVLVYSLQKETYVGSRPYIEGMTVESLLFPDLRPTVDQIFEGIDW